MLAFLHFAWAADTINAQDDKRRIFLTGRTIWQVIDYLVSLE